MFKRIFITTVRHSFVKSQNIIKFYSKAALLVYNKFLFKISNR